MKSLSTRRLLHGTFVLLSSSALAACGAVIPDDFLSFEDCCEGLPPPPPDPDPSTQPATILAATAPGVGSNTDRVQWSQELDNEEVVGDQPFRLVQYASEYNTGIPALIGPSAPTNNSGASLIVNIPADPDGEATFALSIDNGVYPDPIALTPSETGPFLEATLDDGSQVRVFLDSSDQSTAGAGGELQWTAYGNWSVTNATMGNPTVGARADFVTGAETPDGNMPTTGTATFDGFVLGTVALGDGPNLKVASLRGDATMTADFANGTISGSAPTIIAIPLGQLPLPDGPITPGASQPWNGLSFVGSFTQGLNGFTGNTNITTAPNNSYSLSDAAAGLFSGMFYGPSANELGAVWNLYDSTGVASGVLVGKQP